MKIISTFLLLLIFVYSSYAQCIVSLNSGLVVNLPFSNSTNDASGNSINALNYGAVLTTDRCGNSNSAYQFNGSSNYMSLPTTNIQLTNYTYSLWVKPNDNSVYHSFLSIGGATGGDQAINMDNTSSIAVSWNQGSTLISAGVSTVLNIGTWYYLTTSRDANNVKLYINGSLAQTTNTGGTIITYGNSPVLGFIGARVNSAGYFNGSIDDIRIYNRALCDSEVSALYNLSCTATDITYGISSDDKLTISSNPSSSGIYKLDYLDGIKSDYKVYNSNGFFILQGTIENSTQLDISSYPKGVYTIMIHNDKKIFTNKIIYY